MKGIRSNKPILETIHYRAQDLLIDAVQVGENAGIYEATQENRDRLHYILVNQVLQRVQRHLYCSPDF